MSKSNAVVDAIKEGIVGKHRYRLSIDISNSSAGDEDLPRPVSFKAAKSIAVEGPWERMRPILVTPLPITREMTIFIATSFIMAGYEVVRWEYTGPGQGNGHYIWAWEYQSEEEQAPQ